MRHEQVGGSERGSILVMTAVAMTVLLAITALSIDASYMYEKRNRLHAAADAAAKAGAWEVFRGNTANLTAFAQHELTTLNIDVSDLVVRQCTAGGATCTSPYNTANFVEAIVTEATPTFFGRVLGWTTATPGARAVAGVESGPNCMVVLGDPGVNTTQNVTFNNDNFVTLPNCTISVNGNMSNSGPGNRLSVGGIGVSGTTCTSCPAGKFTTGTPPPLDPLAGLAVPSNPGGCVALGVAQDSPPPGCYSSFIVNTNRTVTLAAGGTYYLTGGMNISSTATINGNGVLIYIDTGGVVIGSDVRLGLSAQTSGVYDGVLMFQKRLNSTGAQFQNMGNNGSNLTGTISGALYFAGASVTFDWSNNSGVAAGGSNCVVVVAKQIFMQNNATGNFGSTCSAFGGTPLRTIAMAE